MNTNEKEQFQEEWRLVASLNNRYEVSNTGKIRNAITKKILKNQINKHGYCVLTVRPVPKKQVNIRVHRIVAEVFLGICPEGYVVNHKDGNKLNNYVTNLEYVTSSENNIHALENGLRHVADMEKVIKRGEESPHSIITEEMAIEMLKYAYVHNCGCRKLAQIFNTTRGVTGNLLANRTWKHIDREKIKQEVLYE